MTIATPAVMPALPAVPIALSSALVRDEGNGGTTTLGCALTLSRNGRTIAPLTAMGWLVAARI